MSKPADMTVREYLAAHAPITMDEAYQALKRMGSPEPTGREVFEFLAMMRWEYADIMIAERDK